MVVVNLKIFKELLWLCHIIAASSIFTKDELDFNSAYNNACLEHKKIMVYWTWLYFTAISTVTVLDLDQMCDFILDIHEIVTRLTFFKQR
jgi:hypothetical protein